MISKKENIVEELRGRQPFRVPDGYFESLTDEFMRSLPKKAKPETKVISFYDRVKPWLYIAAVFTGIIILFNIYYKTSAISEKEKSALTSIIFNVEEGDGDDEDFLEFFEEMYVDKYAISYIIDDYLID